MDQKPESYDRHVAKDNSINKRIQTEEFGGVFLLDVVSVNADAEASV